MIRDIDIPHQCMLPDEHQRDPHAADPVLAGQFREFLLVRPVMVKFQVLDGEARVFQRKFGEEWLDSITVFASFAIKEECGNGRF
jgi:hypothetical protein